MVSVTKFVIPSGMVHWLSGLELRSSRPRFVNVFGRAKLVRALMLSRSADKLRAVSKPSMLRIFRLVAFRLVRLSMSGTVSGPTGFCNAARIAASRPASGMDTACPCADTRKAIEMTSQIKQKIDLTPRKTDETGRCSHDGSLVPSRLASLEDERGPFGTIRGTNRGPLRVIAPTHRCESS